MRRWYMLFVLTLTYAFSVMDRQILSILLEDLRAEFLLSDTQLGLLSGIAFALFYATLGIPIARLADRSHRVNIISIAVAVWSVATALCGAVVSFWQLFVARISVGIGEAGASPPAYSLISDYFAAEQRGTAVSIYMLGSSVGSLLGLVVGGFVAELYGWRWAFVAVGLPGLALALLAKLSMREPPRGALDQAEESTGKAAQERPSFAQVVADLAQNYVYRQALAGHVLAGFVGYAMFSWLAVLYLRQFDLGQGAVGSIVGGLTVICATPGLLIGGFLSDRLGKKQTGWRLRMPAIALCLCLPLYLTALWQDSYITMSIFVGAGLFAYNLGHAPPVAVMQNVVAPNVRAQATSFNFFFINILGLGLGPLLVGFISDVTEPRFGIDALRVALTVVMFVLIPAAILLWRGGAALERG